VASGQWQVPRLHQHPRTLRPTQIAAEHYGGLAQYIKIDVTKSPIVFIDGGKRTKFVFSKNPEAITVEDVTGFAEAVAAGRAKEYKIDEEVKVTETVEEEL
jgi:hypothetical protein